MPTPPTGKCLFFSFSGTRSVCSFSVSLVAALIQGGRLKEEGGKWQADSLR